jgi:hypothetical protein
MRLVARSIMNRAEIDDVANALETAVELDDAAMFPVIGMFNRAMLGNVDGPNCTDRETCNNNCCSIMIDTPRFLAQKYIDASRLRPADLRRGDAFSWKLNVNDVTGKCVFFSPKLYGCQMYVDDLDARPPQCAIYPAGYTTGAIACKAGAGPWIVKDEMLGASCERLMALYKNYCVAERERDKDALISNVVSMIDTRFVRLLGGTCPSGIAGVKDTWDGLEPLLADGKSLSIRMFCIDGCPTGFLQCDCMCEGASRAFADFLKDVLPAYIAARDMKEEYTILELKDFISKEKRKNG